MTAFMLDTDLVSAVGSSIDSLASQLDNLESSVSSYDTNCQDGFSFDAAKNAIANNIQACGIKMKNTSIVIDNVVSSHTRLQQSLVFGSDNNQNTSSNSSGGNRGYSSYGGYYNNSGGYYSSGGGFSTYTASAISYSNLDENTPSSSYSNYTKQNSDYDDSVDTYTPKYDDVVKNVSTPIKSVENGLVDLNTLGDDGKSFFEDNEFEYNESGYTLLNGLFVIGCGSAVGKVGDLIKISLSDGRVIDCIIGDNSLNTDGIKFFVNDTWVEGNSDNIAFNPEDISSITNYGSNGASVYFDTVNLPEIGENTSDLELFDEEWTVVSTKVSVDEYVDVIEKNKITQDSDIEKYGGACLPISYTHASNLYSGKLDDVIGDDSGYKYVDEFNSFYSDSKDETLKVIYSEILRGKPVIMQVNGNQDGSNKHFVTVVGFRKGITDSSELTEEDLLVIDPWDGKVERMDQDDSRFMTTGKQSGDNYTGYYLRCLKNEEKEEE